MAPNDFKSCTQCQVSWQCCEDFIQDLDLHLHGYQASFDDPDGGLFLLSHRVDGCGTTLAVAAGRFRHRYDGACRSDSKAGTAECPGLCLDEGRLEACTAPCAMAWVREVLQCLRRHELPPANTDCVR